MLNQQRLKPLRLSSSLILTKSDHESQILMLNRKPHMSFANSLVFPGGVCEPSDTITSNHFQQFAKITAIRQTLEQTGILIVPPSKSLSNIDQLQQLYANQREKQLNQLILQLWNQQLDYLVPIARFVTPQIPKISRFDCIFYIPKPTVSRINLGKAGPCLDELDIHLKESSKYYWLNAQSYLKMHQQQQIFLPPPQNIILNVLCRKHEDEWNVNIEPFLGQFSSNMQYFMLPGDHKYDYKQISKTEPESKSKEQLRQYLERKQKEMKGGQLRRFKKLTPAPGMNKTANIQVIIQNHEEKSLLKYLLPPKSSL